MTRQTQIVTAFAVVAVGAVAFVVARRPAASLTSQSDSLSAPTAAPHHLGVAVADSAFNWCAKFDNTYPEKLAAEGDRMTLIWSDSSASRASVMAHVRKVRYGMCHRPGLDSATAADADSSAARNGEIAYDLTLDGTLDVANTPRIAHAITGASTWGFGANGWPHGDIDGDDIPEFVRECTSSEGLHLTLWRQRAGVGAQRLAHYYHYLGYDVVPSCTDEEVRDT